jgi:hypothetical protein
LDHIHGDLRARGLFPVKRARNSSRVRTGAAALLLPAGDKHHACRDQQEDSRGQYFFLHLSTPSPALLLLDTGLFNMIQNIPDPGIWQLKSFSIFSYFY